MSRTGGQRGSGRRRRIAWAGAAAGGLSATLVAVALAASTNFVEAPGSPVTVGINPQGTVAADLDGDLDVDLATVNVSGGDVTILKNNGTGRFHATAREPGGGRLPDRHRRRRSRR